MIQLQELQRFCKNGRIILVGNSSRMLNHNYGKLIDSYDIVVRMNWGYRIDSMYQQHIGEKTDIVSSGIKSASFATSALNGNRVKYVICPIRYSEPLRYPNVYRCDDEDYDILKKQLGGVKPSTGLCTFNFFHKHVEYRNLDLVGFDFFESSGDYRNEFGHMRVDDHRGHKEKEWFDTYADEDKTYIHILKEGGNMYDAGNIPRIKIKGYTKIRR